MSTELKIVESSVFLLSVLIFIVFSKKNQNFLSWEDFPKFTFSAVFHLLGDFYTLDSDLNLRFNDCYHLVVIYLFFSSFLKFLTELYSFYFYNFFLSHQMYTWINDPGKELVPDIKM